MLCHLYIVITSCMNGDKLKHFVQPQLTDEKDRI